MFAKLANFADFANPNPLTLTPNPKEDQVFPERAEVLRTCPVDAATRPGGCAAECPADLLGGSPFYDVRDPASLEN